MGKIVEKKKKKKGRPSLLDLQKRNLKQQQQREEELRKKRQQQKQLKRTHKKFQNPNPTTLRRSARRNPNPDLTSSDAAAGGDGDDAEENNEQSIGRRREKKLNLVLKLHDSSATCPSSNSGSDSNGEDKNTATTSRKRRKVEAIGDGSGEKGEKQCAPISRANSCQEVELDDGPSTPLPNKKLLLFILDRLQKKDTYGVFADPVDPEELPDYHDVIEHPMDFSTIRKNLTNGAYNNLEQFERDVFLLCSNAMQYNAPSTIYFRQAHSIQELAKKNFENLRQDSDSNELETKVVGRGRQLTKNLKKPVGRPPLERANSDYQETTLATGRENANLSNFNLRKATSSDKYGSADLFGRISYGSHHGEVYISWSAEKYGADEITGSVSKGISVKHGKKQVTLDENRRNTYKLPGPSATRQGASVLMTFHGERKQLVPVGLHLEYGYARSVARFAGKLGPIAWKIASKKIERCLPAGVKFGPGWVGENQVGIIRPLHRTSSPTPTHNLLENPQVDSPLYQQVLPGQASLENCPSTANLPVSSYAIDSGPSPVATSCSSGPTLGTVEAVRAYHPHPTGFVRSRPPIQAQKSSSLEPQVNGITGFIIPSQMGELLGPARSFTGVKSHSNLMVSTSSETESNRDRSLKAEKNDMGGAQSAENTITIQHDGNSLPAPSLNKQPSGLG